MNTKSLVFAFALVSFLASGSTSRAQMNMTFDLATLGDLANGGVYQEDGIKVVSHSDYSRFLRDVYDTWTGTYYPGQFLYFHGTDQYLEFSLAYGGTFDLLSFDLGTNGYADRWIQTSKTSGEVAIGDPLPFTHLTFSNSDFTGIEWFRIGTPSYGTMVDNVTVIPEPGYCTLFLGGAASGLVFLYRARRRLHRRE